MNAHNGKPPATVGPSAPHSLLRPNREMFAEIEGDPDWLAGHFIGPVAKVGDVVDLVCVEAEPGRYGFMLRVRQS